MEELIEQAKKGDKNAFSQLIKNIENDLYWIAKTRIKNDDDIGDVLQETIYKCYKNIKKLRENSYFKTGIVKILINECNYIYKKNCKKCISYEDKEIENYLDSDFEWRNEENIENLDFYILIDGLSYEEKLILTLYYYSEYTTKEISKITKINENTIKSKLNRAKIKIKKKIEKGEIEYGKF